MQADAFAHLAFPLAREQTIGNLLPYSSQVSPSIIACYDQSHLILIQFDGQSYEGKSEHELTAALMQRNQVFKLLNRPDLSVHYLQIKRRREPPEHGTSNNIFDRIYRRYHTNNEDAYYTIEHYLAVIHHPPLNRTLSLIDKLKSLKLDPQQVKIQADEAIRTLNSVAKRILNAMVSYKPRLLTVKDQMLTGIPVSEPLTLLAYLVNHEYKPVPLSNNIEINQILSRKRADFSAGGAGRVGDYLFASKSVKDYGMSIRSGCLDPILSLPIESILSISFRFGLHSDAVERIQRQYRLLVQSEDVGISDTEALHYALDQLQSGEFIIGESCMHLLHFAKNSNELKDQDSALTQVFDRAGLIPVDDDMALQAKWLATFPGNWKYRSRVLTGLHSQNIAALATWRRLPQGNCQHHWGDAPLMVVPTTAGTPYELTLHVGDLGNTLVVGQSGGGKTVLMSFLAMCCARIGARVVFYDKDRGAEIFLRALGGDYHTITPGQSTGFNPFSLEPTPENTAFVTDLVQTLLTTTHLTFTPDQLETITRAVTVIFQMPAPQRRLRTLQELLSQSNQADLVHALKPWITQGQHAWAFDNTEQENLTNQLTGFDLTDILDHAELKGPILRYMTHLVEHELIDGSPVCIVIDEGWRGLDDPGFADQIKNLEKTIRKRNGIVIFGSNNPADLLRTEAGREVIRQSPSHIFTPNQAGSAEDYEGYQLSKSQVDLLLSLRKDSREFVLIQDEETVQCRFDLGTVPGIIKILSGRESTVNEMHRLITRYGANPANWLPHFEPNFAEIHHE